MNTNRDLYLGVITMLRRQRGNARSLEEYLRALYGLAKALDGRKSIPTEEFVGLLGNAFTADPLPFDEAWRAGEGAAGERKKGAAGWRSTIERQIVDLRELDEQGKLVDKYRYFGLDASRGGRWFNFDPCMFLECAAEGAFGGWRQGDESPKACVPGATASMEEDGRLVVREAQDPDRPLVEVLEISWERFREFLWIGQCYE